MKPAFFAMLMIWALNALAQSAAEVPPHRQTDPRLQAPGTLSGYAQSGENRSEPEPALAPSTLSAPRVLRFHDEGGNPEDEAFPQLGRTPGLSNPWGRRGAGAMPGRGRLLPPPHGQRDLVNPWRLDEQLLSAPGIPGLDRSLPLAPADPLLSPMPYMPLPGSGYGIYPPPGGSPLYPFGGASLPGFGGDRSRFPFTPMDWF